MKTRMFRTKITMIAMAAALLGPSPVGAANDVERHEPDKVLATTILETIDGIDITQEDADRIRALVSPPPSKDAAERLAIDSALAYWDTTRNLRGSTVKERLAAWREWMTKIALNDESTAGTRAKSELERVRSQLAVESPKQIAPKE